MYAKNLERILGLLCEHDDISHSLPDEYAERFKSLRGSALPPRGRVRREERLSNAQIGAAVFGLVPSRPSWATSRRPRCKKDRKAFASRPDMQPRPR